MPCSLPHCNLTKLRGARSAIFNYCTLWFTTIPTVSADPKKLAHPQNLHIVYMTLNKTKNPQRFVWNVFFTNWLVLSAEQMSKRTAIFPTKLLNNEQMRSWLGVEYCMASQGWLSNYLYFALHWFGLEFCSLGHGWSSTLASRKKRIPGVFGTQLMEPGAIIGDWFHSLIQNKQVFMVIVMMNWTK